MEEMVTLVTPNGGCLGRKVNITRRLYHESMSTYRLIFSNYSANQRTNLINPSLPTSIFSPPSSFLKHKPIATVEI